MWLLSKLYNRTFLIIQNHVFMHFVFIHLTFTIRLNPNRFPLRVFFRHFLFVALLSHLSLYLFVIFSASVTMLEANFFLSAHLKKWGRFCLGYCCCCCYCLLQQCEAPISENSIKDLCFHKHSHNPSSLDMVGAYQTVRRLRLCRNSFSILYTMP